MSDLLTIILAAGQGTRMKSNLTKVLHHVSGKPMVMHVIDTVKELGSNIIVIIGHQAEQVKTELAGEDILFVEQKDRLGTGHAVIQTMDMIKNHQGSILILYGDTPLLTSSTLNNLIEKKESFKAKAAILTAIVEDPTGYGRILKDEQRNVSCIVEEKDANFGEKSIKEINSGVYCFDSKDLIEGLENLDNNNAQGEYYLTDVIGFIRKKQGQVIPVPVNDINEIIGVNDRIQLAQVESILRRRINQKHMKNGVTIIDPATTYIDSQVVIDRDTVVYPFTYLEGNTRIGEGTVIGPSCRIINSEIGDNVSLKDHSIIINSKVVGESNIGPFAYIRPGSFIEKGAKVGDFVELKNARIGRKSKIPHLSYVGDAEIGEGTNIGAGTIFANYDGENKHRTKIGNSVFVGSNSTLVAPITINDRGRTGAGSVITKNVPEGITVVGVPAKEFKKRGGSKNN